MELGENPDMMKGNPAFSEPIMRRATPILLLLAGVLSAQGNPVSWTVKAPAKVTANETFTVEVQVAIDAPFHIYGLDLQETGQSTAFSASPPDGRVVVTGDPAPSRAASLHDDEYGKYTYWENEVTFQVPVKVKGAEAAENLTFELVMDYMACTSEGCLPPMTLTREITVAASEGEAVAEPPVADPVTSGAFGVIPVDSDEQEYPVTLKGGSVGEIKDGLFAAEVTVSIAAPYHIYGCGGSDSEEVTALSVVGSVGVARAGEPTADKAPKDYADEYTTYTYWDGDVTFTLPLRIVSAAAGEVLKFKLRVAHVACDATSCLQPANLDLDLEVTSPEQVDAPSATLDGEAIPGREVELVIPLAAGTASAGDTIAKGRIRFLNDHLLAAGDGIVEVAGDAQALRLPVLVHENLADGQALDIKGLVDLDSGKVRFTVAGTVSQPITAFILLAAVAALFALLTPCVFPMIPITISFFTKQAESAPYPPVTMGIVYCGGIVLSFTAIGVLFTLALGPGGAIAFAQSRVTLGLIALLFIVFALSLFGMFELRLPASVMNLAGRAQGKGGLIGVLLLGLLFAVTSFACTAPFVGTILAGAAASGAWTRPIVGMVVFSGVLAVPFFFLSIFPSRLKSMPRSGGWLNEVKVVMGFIEIAAAFKFLGDMEPTIFTRFLILCVWTVTFGACGVYLLGLFRLPHDGPKEKVGVLGMVFALFFLSLALYCTKGLDGESLSKDVDAYLPDEVVARTPLGRRQAIVRELGLVGAVHMTDAKGTRAGVVADRVGYDHAFHYWDKDRGQVVDENPYEDAIAEAKRLGTALFIDFTGYA